MEHTNLSKIMLNYIKFLFFLVGCYNSQGFFGSKNQRLAEDNFTTPRAVVSLRFFNCFRLLLEKAEDPDDAQLISATTPREVSHR
jgi:hypothetical protein